ncbi:MAG TPA: nickel-binding protein [Chryseolinea sp.]|nr:nickel-binding protein [Chryseolinea sp.]
MPLYIDYHDLDDFDENTLEALKQGHKLDLAVQEKYNVQYKHYYISKDNRKAYCVMEGPNRESCEAVHREAHGLLACNIVEVELSQYGAILGLPKSDIDGMNLHDDGTIDSGFRTILLINTLPSASTEPNDTFQFSLYFTEYLNQLNAVLSQYGGRELTAGKSETTYAFTSCMNALRCSIALQERITLLNNSLRDKKIRFETTIVLDAGEPVTRNDKFFGDTLQLARRLSHRGKDGDIVISSCVHEHAQPPAQAHLKITGSEDERFINSIMSILEHKLRDENFNVIELTERAGISRPQLYRKIHNLFDQSPNRLIHEMRLRESVRLIHRKFGNISEIAYEVGYNNPSYFAKCFLKRFGMLPSSYSARQLPSA